MTADSQSSSPAPNEADNPAGTIPGDSSLFTTFAWLKQHVVTWVGILLCLFTLIEANFSRLQEISRLAIFTMLGMVLCFLLYPVAKRWKEVRSLRVLDVFLALVTVACCMYVVVQSEDMFQALWFNDMSLGSRVSAETTLDKIVAIVGILLVLECTRRAIGLVVPLLAVLFIAHSYYCYLAREYQFPTLPPFMLPHSGSDLVDIATTTFLNNRGVFGTAASVMFKYVFLFVIFGTFLEVSGATQFIISFAERVFGRSPGGPAKVSVLGSGLMGSLSGSAVANAMTTGAFTIPMMRNAGFDREAAGGITAAAASGGALVPPVMGAGAYMMLELVQPQVTFLQIARAAIIPSALYYFSLWMIVHFYSRRMGAKQIQSKAKQGPQINVFDGVVFFTALAVLIGLLLMKFTPFRAVSGSLLAILLLTSFRQTLPSGQQLTVVARSVMWIAFLVGTSIFAAFSLGWFGSNSNPIPDTFRGWLSLILEASLVGMISMLILGLFQRSWRPELRQALSKSAKGAIALVAASACVGIIIAIVDSSGIANDFSSQIKSVVASSLFIALVGIMVCSIILGMGVPSVVCYLLMATLMGSLLSELGVIPLGAHFFIFYFGMMSMVTPPVALAAYASASIAGSSIMRTSFAAFKFSLVGFTLPYMFVYRPALLLMNETKWNAWIAAARENATDADVLLSQANDAMPYASNFAIAVIASVVGIIALAAGIAGYIRTNMSWWERAASIAAAALLLVPIIPFQGRDIGAVVNVAGGLLFIGVYLFNVYRARNRPTDNAQAEATSPL